MIGHLAQICYAIWLALSPHSPRPPDADVLASAIATAVDADPVPVFGDADTEAAVAAVFVFYESRVRLHPEQWIDPRTGEPADSHARGAYQIRGHAGEGNALTQTYAWLALLHDGEKRCADSPAAPLSGSCLLARRLADRRVALAKRLLSQLSLETASE